VDLPVVVEISNSETKINNFLPLLHDMFENSGCGGLVTIEDVRVIRYLREKDKKV
jgi:PII-like signaling protein